MTTATADISIVMFDDQGDHQSKADLLHEYTGYDVRFVNLQGKDVISEVDATLSESPEPQLVIVDHILDKAQWTFGVHKGTSIVPILRERWPTTPIIAVTAAYDDCVKDITGDYYEAIFRSEQFSILIQYLPSLVAGYDVIRHSVDNLDALLDALEAPSTDRSAISTVIPISIKNSFGQPALGHHIFRWFRHLFYREPGFLLDRSWTALAIGVMDDHFEHYSTAIENAQYTGLFMDDADPRWWKSSLYSSLLPESPKRFTISLCEAAAEKLGIPVSQASKCHRCGDKWPEVMGFVDEASIQQLSAVPLHLRCSRVYQRSEVMPYYEERRVMLEDE